MNISYSLTNCCVGYRLKLFILVFGIFHYVAHELHGQEANVITPAAEHHLRGKKHDRPGAFWFGQNSEIYYMDGWRNVVRLGDQSKIKLPFQCVSVSPYGLTKVVNDSRLRKTCLVTESRKHCLDTTGSEFFRSGGVHYSPDGRLFSFFKRLRGDESKFEPKYIYRAVTYEIASGRKVNESILPFEIEDFSRPAFSNDATKVFLVAELENLKSEMMLIAVDLETKELKWKKPADKYGAQPLLLAIESSDELLIFRDYGKAFDVVDLKNGKQKLIVEVGHKYSSLALNPIPKVALSPKQKWLAMINYSHKNGCIQLFSTMDWKAKYTLAPERFAEHYDTQGEGALRWKDANHLVALMKVNYRGSSRAFLEWEVPEG